MSTLQVASFPHRPEPVSPDELTLGELDCAAVLLRGLLDRLLPPTARAAHAFADAFGWQDFGYARAEDFSREVLGRSGRWLRRIARIGRAIDAWPRLARAITGDDGGPPLGQEAAYQLSRVVDDGTLEAWIAHARTVTLRRLREDVRAALATGDEAPCPPRDHAPAAPAADRPRPDDNEPRVRLRLTMPGPLRAAFEETLDLHRAVCGSDASVTSFVEALVAEAQAGPAPPDLERPVDAAPFGRAHRHAAARRAPKPSLSVEQGLDAGDPLDAWLDLRCLRTVVTDAARLIRLAGRSGPEAAGEELLALLEIEQRGERLLGEALAALGRGRGFALHGFRSLDDYAERRLGMSASTARELAFVARATRDRPALRDAWQFGFVSTQKMLTLLRGLGDGDLDPERERLWAVEAERMTCKRLADEARMLRRRRWMRDDTAPAAVPAVPSPHRRPAACDDRAWRRAQARAYGRTKARLLEAACAVVDDPRADASLTLALPETVARQFVATLEQLEPDREFLALVAARRPEISSRMFSEIDGPESRDWRLFSALWSYASEWDRGVRRHEDRIYARDGWRCQAPGCTARRNLESHHVVWRSRGGSDDDDNLVTLCRFHHQRGEHGELMAVTGRAPDGLTFVLGRDGRGGTFRNERASGRHR
ncbi:MAG: HNH endonuclease [Acidobacteria bacterium]|nr:MAG: HNH endonuclease [Acidobacteriota bacterium]